MHPLILICYDSTMYNTNFLMGTQKYITYDDYSTCGPTFFYIYIVKSIKYEDVIGRYKRFNIYFIVKWIDCFFFQTYGTN